MRTLFAVIVMYLAVAGVAAEPQTLTGKVVAVAGGDTLTLLDAANVQIGGKDRKMLRRGEVLWQ
jgi:hypothetical protein